MAEDSNNKNGPFNVETIEYLVGLMSKHDISEMDLLSEGQRVRLRRGSLVQPTVSASPVQNVAQVATVPHASPAVHPHSAAAVTTEKPAKKLIEIKSPAIGTFYLKEKPEAPQPYVSIGSKIGPKTTVGLIEAMKLFSEIPAGISGVVEEILVENGQAVEFNQVLFRVDPSR